MSTSVYTATVVGVEAVPVEVEVDLVRRLPAVSIVGLPAPSIRESADRIRSALKETGIDFPRARVVVSLAPADLRKEGPGFDLPMAVAILGAAGRVPAERCRPWLFVGELALSGETRPVRGVLAMACLARDLGLRGVVVPLACAREAALVDGIEVVGVRSLREVVDLLEGELVPSDPPAHPPEANRPPPLDLREVRGQPVARHALEVAAAGGHNLLLVGPPGCGKSMLAARIPSILPALERSEALECTRIHSIAGLRPADGGIVDRRPFRAPHHSVSSAGLLGGSTLRPGEVTLAHHGVLFLDEFPEFPRHVREALRAPLEDRRVVLSRAAGTVLLPASFMLVAAANPCPCGYLGHPTRPCGCTATDRARYQARLSGPLVDRLDLGVELLPVASLDLLAGPDGESSAAVRTRVEAARRRQHARFGGALTNASVPADRVREVVDAGPGVFASLQALMDHQGFSARVAGRMLRVARTLADLEGRVQVAPEHIHAAIALRLPRDEQEAA